ncbi:hypothetical protein [Gordonia paraffinivorans]|nr:hypothetical protein [Gordonia paraffinivorans]
MTGHPVRLHTLGRIKGVKVGRRRLIPMREIDRLISGDVAA